MCRKQVTKVSLGMVLPAFIIWLGAAPVQAANVTFELCADEGTVTMPDSVVVPIWGFSINDGLADCTDDPAGLPGPQLHVNEGDNVTINLTDNVAAQAVTLQFPGQVGVSVSGSSYSFTASNPGTFLYEPGSNPGIQLAMGLYGALIVHPVSAPDTPIPNQAYDVPQAAFDDAHDYVLVLSELDPALNADPAGFDLNDYDPVYWLIDGKAYPDTDPILANSGEKLLLRYLNAGSTHHTMSLLGMRQNVIATDSFLLEFPMEMVSQTVPTGQTADVIATASPFAGSHPLYNRQLNITNALPGPDHFPGGMLTFIMVDGDSPPPVEPPDPSAVVVLYFSTTGIVSIPGVPGPNDDADVYAFYDDGSYSRVFDGQDAGLPGNADIDGLKVVDHDTIYMSFHLDDIAVPGVGNVDDSDIVLYDGGTWSMYFDGSDVNLTRGGEDVDAFDILPDGSLIISTRGSPSVPGVSGDRDEDLIRCEGTFGPATSCTWSMYFDGSDINLDDSSEDVDAVSVSGTTIALSTVGNFSVNGVSGRDEDVFHCLGATTGTGTSCSSLELAYDGSAEGVSNDLDAIDLP